MANSADPDQLASSVQKPTDLDLHCLLRQGMSSTGREGVIKILKKSYRVVLKRKERKHV